MIRSSVVLPLPDGPQERGQLAVGDVERDVVERHERPEALGQVLDRDGHVVSLPEWSPAARRRPRRCRRRRSRPD